MNKIKYLVASIILALVSLAAAIASTAYPIIQVWFIFVSAITLIGSVITFSVWF